MNERGAFTVAEFSAWARIGRTKLYELIASGELPIVKIGKKTLIRSGDGQALLDKLTKTSGEASSAKSQAD